MVCTFSASQLLKVLRRWSVLYILAWKRATRHNCVQLFISHLTTWLCTWRFSEPTFRPSGATNHWRNIVLRLSLFWSSFFCSSLLWLFPPVLFHLSILSEVWLLNFLRPLQNCCHPLWTTRWYLHYTTSKLPTPLADRNIHFHVYEQARHNTLILTLYHFKIATPSVIYIHFQKGTLSGPHFSTFLGMQRFCLHHVQSFMFIYLWWYC